MSIAPPGSQQRATAARGNGRIGDGVGISLHHRDLSRGSGEADIGVKLVGAVRRMYHEYGVVEWAIERAVRGRIEKSARAALGDEGYETAVRSGEAMPREEAIELALSIT